MLKPQLKTHPVLVPSSGVFLDAIAAASYALNRAEVRRPVGAVIEVMGAVSEFSCGGSRHGTRSS